MYRRFRLETAYCAVLLCWLVTANAEGDVVRNEDICGPQNGRRLYLELGEKGILYAKNVSFAKTEARQDGSQIYTNNSSHAQCTLELVTCPSCVIIVTFQSISLSHHCSDGSVTMDSPCRCDYVWISEPPYEDVSGTPFCGLYAPITYRSSTRTLSITLLYSESRRHAFTLEYTAERNRLHLRGTELTGQTAKGLNSTGGGILTSPFFPARYPRDLGLEYVVACPSEAPSCRIRLLFSDFQLATVSIMEFYDWNGQRLDVSSGARFRPPVIMSSGPSLLIRFYANGGTGLGYKAFYSFVVGHAFDKSVQPITDCGGYVENLGGAITMMDMVGVEGVKTYDCVWLIRPPKNFLHAKTHIYLKVVAFADMAGNTELVVRQGPTSALMPLEILRHPASQVQPPRYREHVAPVSSGFHVSLRGTFGSSSNLAIAYATFSYMDCFAGSDFLCRNHRCIPSQLNCDGFDHCGDNSDEPATCFRDWDAEPQDRKWHSNKANYYFPKIDRYPDLKTATLVFVASSLGLIVLISALIVLLYKMGARARQQRELQSRLQTISELLVFDIADGARIDEIAVSDDPPVYEAPPGYDEVVKLGLDSEILARKKRSACGPHGSRGTSSPGRGCSMERSSDCSTADAASTSRGNRPTMPIPVPCNGGEVVAEVDTNADADANPPKRISYLPDSPPPPYVTPPGSISRHFGLASIFRRRDSREETSQDDRGESETSREDEEMIRRGGREWTRRPGAFSLSLSESCGQSTPEMLVRSSLSIDADLLGAYVRNREISSSFRTADASCDSQPRSSRVASTDTEPECVERGRDSEPANEETMCQDRQLEKPAPVDREHERAAVEAAGSPDDAPQLGCCCEGACGCATVRDLSVARRWPPIRRVSVPREAQPPADRSTRPSTSTETERHQDETDFYRSKNAIVRLLNSRTGRWHCGSGSSTTASSPCGTFKRSARMLSVCSRDGHRLGGMGTTSSYEKLSNVDFEIDRRTLLHVSDPILIDSCSQRRHSRRYSSCDLESLCEGIRALDDVLSHGSYAVAHAHARARKQSVTIMLFGTPKHRTIRRRTSDEDPARQIATSDAISCCSN
ncbi:CUB and LDLa domain isoform X1 [Halictus rubicundus]|uniref:CUB and LDLa domain isoform X1 n=1 Tax=Halictus rubicundus TaxID=77578 RepID=UPI004034F9F0